MSSEMDVMTPFDGFSDPNELALSGSAPGARGGDAPKPRSLAATLHRHMRGRYWIALPLGVIFGLAGGYYGWKSQKPIYRSDAAIQIKYKMPSMPTPDGRSNGGTLVGEIPMYDEYMATQYYLITSRRVISQALERDEWKNTGRGDDMETVMMFADNLVVEHPRQTQTLHISYTDRDPGVAAAGANAIVRTYEELYKKGDKDTQDGAVQKLIEASVDKQRLIRDEKRQISELAVANYGTEDVEPIYKNEQDQYIQLDQRLNQLTWALAQRAANVDPGKAFDRLTNEKIGMMDPVMASKIAIKSDRQQDVARLEVSQGWRSQSLKSAQASLERASQDVEDYGKEYREFQKELANDVDLGTNGSSSLAQRLTMSKEALQQEINSVQALCDKQKAKMNEVGGIVRAIHDHQDHIKEYTEDLQKMEHEKEIFEFQTSGPQRLLVLNPGEVPVVPIKDGRKKVAIAGGLGGGLLPIFICIGLGLMNKRYRYSDDTQAASGMPPLLGILPTLPDKLSDPEQAAIAAHCIHQLRIMLQVNGGLSGSGGGSGTERRVYMITSASAGDGKTSLTMALGLSFAASGSRTLVVDCDMVGQGLTNRLKARSSEGLQEALCAGTLQGRVKKTTTPNLYILPIGGAESGHAGALSPVSIRRLLVEARRIFDVVIIDTGPVLGSLEAQVIAAAADSVILTIARGQHHQLVERSVRLLQQVGAKVAGMVFNRAEKHDFQRSVGSSSLKSMSSTPRSQRMLIADSSEESRFGPLARSVASFMPAPSSAKELPAKPETAKASAETAEAQTAVATQDESAVTAPENGDQR
jgi:capsular exopolysaccharide synthesis family protein